MADRDLRSQNDETDWLIVHDALISIAKAHQIPLSDVTRLAREAADDIDAKERSRAYPRNTTLKNLTVNK